MYFSNDPRFKHLRKEFRKNASKYERILWERLKEKCLTATNLEEIIKFSGIILIFIVMRKN